MEEEGRKMSKEKAKEGHDGWCKSRRGKGEGKKCGRESEALGVAVSGCSAQGIEQKVPELLKELSA